MKIPADFRALVVQQRKRLAEDIDAHRNEAVSRKADAEAAERQAVATEKRLAALDDYLRSVGLSPEGMV